MMQQFKQEYPEIKKESDVNSEKDFEEINLGFRIINPNKVKQEKPETTENQKNQQQKQPEADKSSLVPVPMDIEEKEPVIEEVNTVNLINESGDESTSTSSKRKSDDSNDDVIELSDNSVLEAPPRRLSLVPALKRRKLLERPICTPKKSPPNSYKSLIKQNSNFSLSSYGISSTSLVPTTAKSKLISTSSALNKSTIRRKSLIFKSQGAFKTLRFAAAKAKRRALNKKKEKQQLTTVDVSKKSQLTKNDENAEPLDEEEEEEEHSSTEKSSEESLTNDVTSEEHIEEKSMDGSSECSGKSNIDLTIDRVAKGYFSESEIFSSLNKHRKTKGQKKFEAKLLVLCEKKKIENELKEKKKSQKSNSMKKVVVASKKKVIRATVNKSKESKKKRKKIQKIKKKIVETVKEDVEECTAVKKAGKSAKKPKAKEPSVDVVIPTPEEKSKKQQAKKLKVEEVSSTHSTPKRKAPVKKALKKIEIETDDDMTMETSVTKDEDTSNTLLSSSPTTTLTTTTQNIVEEAELTPVVVAAVTKPLLDETDVANNNDEYFEDNNHNRYKSQEPLTLYKTPGYGWTTALNKTSNKRGKKAKYTKTKKMRVTIPSDIMIPKSTSIPRWSNGWMWEGSPYQALVFLNVS